MTRFVVVPQWQGSASSRAMMLIDGAEAIAGDLPRGATALVDVPLTAGDALGTRVQRLSALQQIAMLQFEAYTAERASDTDAPGVDPVVTVGGDAGVATNAALASIGAANGALDPRAVVVWIGAHASMNDTVTSPTGAYESMAAGALIGVGGDAAAPVAADPPLLAASRLVLAGSRDLSPAETAAIDEDGVRVVAAGELADDPARVGHAVAALEPSTVFVHVALDVLDPAVISGVIAPRPFGLTTAQLTAAIRGVRDAAPLSGAAITGFAPASPAAAVDDLGTILRIVGALA